jgi:hypothetical protein
MPEPLGALQREEPMPAKAILLVVLVAAVAAAAAILSGRHRWESGTNELRARLEAGRRAVGPAPYDARELDGLPAPVQRYFRKVLRDAQPMIAAVTVEHTGTFNMGEKSDNWKRFASRQRVITQRRGFLWDARVAVVPGIAAYVHDAYVAGEGILHATAFGLVTIMNLRGTRDVAEGELMRFFAEAAWYPTALLPSQGVRWEAVDDSSARATLVDGDITLTMLFTFDDAGLIASTRAEARGRLVEGTAVPTPWEGRVWDYEVRSGMLVPLSGEVAWILPEGPKPYWRGRIERLEYEFAR